MKISYVAVIGLMVLTGRPAALPAQGAPAPAIERRIDTAGDSDVSRLYRIRNYAPLWLDGRGRLNRSGTAALALLRHSPDHGLDTLLYDVPRLAGLLGQAGGAPDPTVGADGEIALTEALIRYLRDLRQGLARPSSLPKDTTATDLVATVLRAAASDSIPSLAQLMAPPFRQYRLLQAALVRERTALNRTPADTAAADHVRRITLALERLRWLPRLGRGRMVVVNVPAFELLAFDFPGDSPQIELRSRVVVGDAARTRTPILFRDLTTVEFWPYWNIPRSILLGEILPALRRHPGYLRSREMEVLDSRNQVVGDRGTPEILSGLAQGRYRVRQRPVRANALGVVKFLFPNAANVYAHDTPARELFERNRRDFSHGCVRVEQAASLAQWVMAREPGWSPERVSKGLQGPATIRVTLAHPIPVLIVYTTAVAEPDGTMRYFDDIYRLDGALAKSLRLPAAR